MDKPQHKRQCFNRVSRNSITTYEIALPDSKTGADVASGGLRALGATACDFHCEWRKDSFSIADSSAAVRLFLQCPRSAYPISSYGTKSAAVDSQGSNNSSRSSKEEIDLESIGGSFAPSSLVLGHVC